MLNLQLRLRADRRLRYACAPIDDCATLARRSTTALRLRADRRLRYASSPIGAIVPIQRTGEQHRDVEICNPCPPTFLLPNSPAGQFPESLTDPACGETKKAWC